MAGHRANSGNKDILIIVLIGLAIVAASIFFILKILGHSEKYVETVKKTKFHYQENLSWRPDARKSDAKIEIDFAKNPTQKSADYGTLNLSENSFKLLRRMPELESLKLSRSIFDERWLKYLTGLPLTYLGLHGTPVSDKSIPTILKMKRLETLDIGDTELTDKGLEELSSSKRLNHIDLSLPRRITNDGIRHLGKMKQLQQLELPYSKYITGKCLASISGLKVLWYLNLESMKIASEDLANLSNLKSLVVLEVSNCNLTDRGAFEIAKFPSLRVLRLNGSEITDKGLIKLAQLKHLERLSIKDCPNITKSAVDKFQAALPRCKINYSRKSSINEQLIRDDVKMELDFLKNEAKNELEKIKSSTSDNN